MGLTARIKGIALYQEMTPRLLAVFFFMSFGALNFGYDNGWWSCVLALPEFAEYYGPPGSTTFPSSWLSAGTGTANAGMLIGCFIAGPLSHRVGRKWAIVVLVSIALVGMIIQNAIQSYWAVMSGRMINGISMGIEANVIPVFMAELAPGAIRGTLVNFYQFWQMTGVLLSTATVLGSSRHYEGQWAFRVVMIVQIFIPVVLLAIVWFLPESPRWLLTKRRREDAFKSLDFIREGSGATREDLNTELDFLMASIEDQETNHHATTYADCFRGSNGRRTLIAVGVQVLQQLQGNSFASTYGVLYMKQIGITDTLQAQVARVCCALFGAIVAFWAADGVGRRPIMMISAALMWGSMWVSAGLSRWWPGALTGAVSNGSLAVLLLWSICNTGGWGSCVWITTSEVATTQLREKTVSIATMFSFTMVLLVSFINPFVQYSPGNLGSGVGFVYGSFSLIAIAFVYFVLPELRGRGLEELDELFQSRVPARKFRHYETHTAGAKTADFRKAESTVEI